MKKLIHVDDARGQLHCDACGFVMPPGYLTFGEHLIGYPCPKCSTDMLTRRDYEDSVRMFRLIDWINKWFGWLGTEAPPKPGIGARVSIRNHDGKAIIRGDDDDR